jgi:hypothetical protein
VAVPAFEGAYQILEYTGAIPAGTTLYLDKKAIVPTSGQNTGPQTLVYSSIRVQRRQWAQSWRDGHVRHDQPVNRHRLIALSDHDWLWRPPVSDIRGHR